MTESRLGSYLFDYFVVELDALGPDRFQSWLKESFYSEIPAPIPPHFQTPELHDETFGEVYEIVVRDLDAERKKIVSDAVQNAIADFPRSGKYEGLFSLALLGEAVGLANLGDLIARVLTVTLPPDSNILKLPDTSIEVFSLREILECGFRMIWGGKAGTEKLCSWAYRFMIKSVDLPPALKPTLSPLYVLARQGLLDLNCSPARDKKGLAFLEAALRGGYFNPGEPFEEYFEVRIEGELFPYDVKQVLKEVNTWLSGPGSERKPLLTDRYNGDPFDGLRKLVEEPSSNPFIARTERDAKYEPEDR